MTDQPGTAIKDWYVYQRQGRYFAVDTEDGRPVRSGPATARDIAQATLRGKFREVVSGSHD